MARRSTHTAEELRTLLVDSAAEILERDGLQGLSARTLARAVGYAPGTIYNHFADLDDVVVQVNLRTIAGLVARLGEAREAAVRDGLAPGETLHRMAAAYIDFAQSRPKLWDALFRLTLPTEDGRRAPLRAEVDRAAVLVMEVLRPLVPDMPPAALRERVLVLWTGLQGICALIADHAANVMGAPPRRHLARLLVDAVVLSLEKAASGGGPEGGRSGGGYAGEAERG